MVADFFEPSMTQQSQGVGINGWSMNLPIPFLRHAGRSQPALEADGWRYLWGYYRHPEVKEENRTRQRIHIAGAV
jgi:hypothetical protein